MVNILDHTSTTLHIRLLVELIIYLSEVNFSFPNFSSKVGPSILLIPRSFSFPVLSSLTFRSFSFSILSRQLFVADLSEVNVLTFRD